MFSFEKSINKKKVLETYSSNNKAKLKNLKQFIGQPVKVNKKLITQTISKAKHLQQWIASHPQFKNNKFSKEFYPRLLNLDFIILEQGLVFPSSVCTQKNYFGLFFLLQQQLDKNIIWSKQAEQKFLDLFSDQVQIVIDHKQKDLDLVNADKIFLNKNNKKASVVRLENINEKIQIFNKAYLNKKINTIENDSVPETDNILSYNNACLLGVNAIEFSEFYKRFQKAEIDLNQWVIKPKNQYQKSYLKLDIDLINKIANKNDQDYIAQKKAEPVFQNSDNYKLELSVQFIQGEPVLVYGKVFKDNMDENCGIVPVIIE